MSEHRRYLQSEVRSARIVIFRSGVTDTRALVRCLEQAGLDYREVSMPMGSAENRERFHTLAQDTGWKTLPQIFVDGSFIGGSDELLCHALLADAGDRVKRYGTWLGYAGLLPFLAGLFAISTADAETRLLFERLFLGYGAVILSFTGAVYWGIAVAGSLHRAHRLMAISVIPSLLGWVSLAAPWLTALTLQLAGFAGLLLYEKTAAAAELPQWYARLRSRLTLVVVVVLASALLTGVIPIVAS